MASEGFNIHATGLRIEEGAVNLTTLRLHQPDSAAISRLAQAFETAWPARPNTMSGARPRIAWVGPEEWMFFDAPGDMSGRVAAAVGGYLHHLCDLSCGRRSWRVDGHRARELLMSGTGLDIHPRAFGPGNCARTRLADMPVLVLAEGPEAFDLVADISLAAHMRAWLRDAMKIAPQ